MPEPLLSADFEWVRHDVGRSLVCGPLAEVAPHLFTTRELPLSGAQGVAEDGWRRLAAALGVTDDRLVRLHQVHGATVLHALAEVSPPGAAGVCGEGDALMTRDPEVALAVKVADCVPILLADRRTGAVAAVHAGWRGTAAAIVEAAVGRLGQAFGSRPEDLVAAIGPSIGPCCYEVGPDVFDTFLEAGMVPDWLSEWFLVAPAPAQSEGLGLGVAARTQGRGAPGKFWLNTWQANADQLAGAGVPREQVFVSGVCTACYSDLLHSYRVDGARAGRMVGAIRRRP